MIYSDPLNLFSTFDNEDFVYTWCIEWIQHYNDLESLFTSICSNGIELRQEEINSYKYFDV
jgi:hypothetical protein